MSEQERMIGTELINALNEAAEVLPESKKERLLGFAEGMVAAHSKCGWKPDKDKQEEAEDA